MRARPLLVGIVLLAAPLAGCVGSSGGPAGDPVQEDGNETQGGGSAPDGGPAWTMRTYDAGNGSPTLWSNGTFEPQEACMPAGCVTQDAFRTVDVTGIVPADAPVLVEVDINYTGPPGLATYGAWLGVEGTTYYGYDSSYQVGSISFDVLLVRASDGAIAVNLQYLFPGPSTEPDPNSDYTIEVTATPVPAAVPQGVPVEVPLEPGQTVNVTAIGESPTDDDALAFRVYGPDDDAVAYVEAEGGVASATWTVPSNLSAGDYVLVNSWTSNLTLATDGDGPMRALTLDFAVSDPTPYPVTGPVQWDFQASTDPVWAGIYVRDTNAQTPLFTTNGVAATATGFEGALTLPGGATANGSVTCTICINAAAFLAGSFLGFGPRQADPGLVAGTYQAELSADASVGWEYGHIISTYVR